MATVKAPIPYCSIQCECGYTGDMDEFCRTPIGGELPRGQYQCPSCGTAVQRRAGVSKLFTVGTETLIIPGKIVLVPVDGRL